MAGPSAMAFASGHGRNLKPSVYMSESERMPGYRNRSHVPPTESRASRTANVLPGHLSWTWYAAQIPEMPAPTISTSTCSSGMRNNPMPKLDSSCVTPVRRRADVDTLDDRLTAPARQDGDAPEARFFAPGAWGPEAGAREHR